MPALRLEIADCSAPAGADPRLPVALRRLVREPDGGSGLELVLRGRTWMDRAGPLSAVRLWSSDRLVFTGRITAEETFAAGPDAGKTVLADGPFGLARLIVVTDAAGRPKIRYGSTTVGAALADLLTRHGPTLQSLHAAGADFFSEPDLDKLTATVDRLWFENRDLAGAVTDLLARGPYRLAIDPVSLAWRMRSENDLPVCNLDLGPGGPFGLAEVRVFESVADACSAVRLVGDQVSARYPAAGFAGAMLQTAGLALERPIDCRDPREVTTARALEYFRRHARPNRQVRLTLTGPLTPDPLIGICRITPSGSDRPDLANGKTFLADRAEYDFAAGTLTLELKTL